MSLRSLLDDGVRHAPEYGGGSSNLLPMALVALRRLGADDHRLAEFAMRQRALLEPAPPPAPWPAGDPWAGRLGDPAAWPAYRALFVEWLGHEGGAAVLAQTLPTLMRGCGAAAFHGLIRTAYALEVGHAGELADGLAYWASRFLPLGDAPVPSARAALDPLAVLHKLRALPLGPRPSEALVIEHMDEVARHPGFARQASKVAIDDETLPRLARHAATLYAASGNFVALHLVTSARAFGVIEPFTDDAASARMQYWLAYAAAHRASGAQEGAPLPEPWTWDRIVEAARASDDAHVVKVVDACRELERTLGDGNWRAASTRALSGR
ncbi:MAG: questin oxidase family protein [Rubrivivax sp.]|jgi:hypothetical protein|nr:questin oxidase family protein [Rubrivivax sp.]